jgi:hypothetical protein
MGDDDKRWAHLREHQWKPGQSGNPAGRPKGKSFVERIEEILGEVVTAKEGELQAEKAEVVARVFVKKLMEGNVQLFLAFLDRVWPKTQHLDLTTGGEPIEPAVVPREPKRLEEVAEVLRDVTGEKLH